MQPWSVIDRAQTADARLVVGLMSGMSMDGLDVAVVRITERAGAPERPSVELVAGESTAYDDELKGRMRGALAGTPGDVAALSAELAELWAHDVVELLDRKGIDRGDVLAIGAHGQTVHHTPRADGAPAITLQVGDAARLAAGTGLPVVADFRQADIAAGGEGAPLIPLADWILFGEPDEVTACQNLGNIANVTVLPPTTDEILAFDTGPANALIDAAARSTDEGRAAGGIDKDGALSATGDIDNDLLLALYTKRSAWLAEKPPKSAGFETFGPGLLDEVGDAFTRLGAADRVRTVVEYTALALRDAYAWHVVTRFPELERVRFSGGGCHNRMLMTRIGALLADLGLVVEALDPTWTDLKEAVGFALLADRTLRGLPGNVPSATGAAHPVVLGAVTPPPR
ncbi:MAG: anhydro-N-acetylmuramic acid kinase [Planctomycetota bacterium]|nr:anhydro-N-acetylmuramic acid kinase [Planctomycetota bacterium]